MIPLKSTLQIYTFINFFSNFRGHFAVVKKCVCKSSNNDVAGKFIKVKKTRTSRQGAERAIIEREAEILQMIDCDKVMKLYDVFDLGSEIVLVMEL